MPATFAVYGRDDDGTGDVSPFDAVDAVMAMGRYDCALLTEVGGLSGQSPVSLMLAAYNAGIGAVIASKGIPPYPQTQAYVSEVESLIPTYTASLAASSATSFGQAVVAAATAQLGVPYSWGGGDAAGPSLGIGSGAKTTGFDCSGLVLYAVAQASGGGIELPHSSELQATMGTAVSAADIQPGDVIAFALGADHSDFDHIGIYIGNNEMIDAPDTGAVVRVDTLDSYWQERAFGDPEFRMRRAVTVPIRVIALCALTAGAAACTTSGQVSPPTRCSGVLRRSWTMPGRKLRHRAPARRPVLISTRPVRLPSLTSRRRGPSIPWSTPGGTPVNWPPVRT